MKRIIALDASSTSIGWVLAEDGKRRFSGTQKLKGTIEARVETAHGFVLGLINTWPGAELLVTEAPVFGHPNSVFPQARVSGVIILAAKLKGIPWREATPTQAKKALTGNGNAKKPEMVAAAAPYLGYDLTQLTIKGVTTCRAYLDGVAVFDEHEADAVSIMVAASTGALV